MIKDVKERLTMLSSKHDMLFPSLELLALIRLKQEMPTSFKVLSRACMHMASSA